MIGVERKERGRETKLVKPCTDDARVLWKFHILLEIGSLIKVS
jgi:hypothetical protein